MKIAFGLGVFVALAVVVWAIFDDGSAGPEAISVADESEVSAAEGRAETAPDQASEAQAADEGAKTVLEIVTEDAKKVAEDTEPEQNGEVGVTVGTLNGELGESLNSAPNKVQKALENVLGGAGVHSGTSSSEGTNEDNVANLEHDAITSETWANLEQALTVEGFDSLAIGQVLLGTELDAETKDAVRSLLTLGEENTDQLQIIIPKIRNLLGL